MEKKALLYEGKAKKVFFTEDPDFLIVEFKDEATAFDGLKKGVITKKGILNNKISSLLFSLLENNNISTHFVKQLSERDMLVKRLEIVKVEVVMRNIVAGSLAKRLGLEEGVELNSPIMELYYKNDELHDPLINEYHIKALRLATTKELTEIKKEAIKTNRVLTKFFQEKGILLVDFKLEFGRYKGQVIIGDEISPDTCRLWDIKTREKLDKDRFRRDLGKVTEAYEEILKRVAGGI